MSTLSLRDIMIWVSREYGFPVSEIKSPSRYREVTHARHIFCWLARQHTKQSLVQIGKFLNNRDHTTILNSVDVIDAAVKDGRLAIDFNPDEIEREHPKGSPWSPEMVAELRSRTRAGLTSEEIGKEMGFSASAVRYQQRRHGIRSECLFVQWTPEMDEAIRKLRFEDGLSFHEIGLHLGCDQKSVRRRFLNLGLSTERVQVTSAPKPVMRVPSLPPKAVGAQSAPQKQPSSKAGERDRYYRADPDLLAGLGRAAKARLKHHDLNTLASLMGLHPSTIERAMEAA